MHPQNGIFKIKLWASILLVLALLVAKKGYSQENNIWTFGGYNGFYSLDFNYCPPRLTVLDVDGQNTSTTINRTTSKVINFTACNSKGQLLAYSRVDTIFNAKGQPFINGGQIASLIAGRGYQLSPTENGIVRVNENGLVDLRAVYTLSDKFYNLMDSTFVFQIGINPTNSTTLPIRFYDTLYFDLKRNKGYHKFLSGMTELRDTSGSAYDMVQVKENAFLFTASSKDSINIGLSASSRGVGAGPHLITSTDKSKIIHSRGAWGDDNEYSWRLMHFTPDSFQTSAMINVAQDCGSFWCGAFSPNDSVIYLHFRNTHSFSRVNRLYRITKKDESFIFKEIILDHAYNSMKLGPDGNIYLLPQLWYYAQNDSININCSIGVIRNPDSDDYSIEEDWRVLEPELSFLELKHIYFVSWPVTHDIYKKVAFATDTACNENAATEFINQSDHNYFIRYRYYFGDGDSADVDPQNTLLASSSSSFINQNGHIAHIYQNPGKYLAKLRAFNDSGGWIWFSDYVTVFPHNTPKFSVDDSISCEWVQFNLHDQSSLHYKGINPIYTWNFGDQSDTSYSINYPEGFRQTIQHTYREEGKYHLSLSINDGYCLDTFELSFNVRILSAAQPGLLIEPKEGCEPLDVTVGYPYQDIVDSIRFKWGDGQSTTAYGSMAYEPTPHTYLIAEEWTHDTSYQLVELLYGPSGCMTSDTTSIKVIKSFYPDQSVDIKLVTVNEQQQISVAWDSLSGVANYHLWRDGKEIITDKLKYIDLTASPTLIHAYVVYAENLCKDTSVHSNVCNNIVLSGESSENNQWSTLQWTPYASWANGIDHYELESGSLDSYFPLSTNLSNSTFNYQDNDYSKDGNGQQKCYRIRAVEGMTGERSTSNLLCLRYAPFVWLPNAFSPNGDGYNDQYSISGLGIVSYHMRIYNRWGQLVYDGDEPWDGAYNGNMASSGVFLVIANVSTIDGEQAMYQSIITLL